MVVRSWGISTVVAIVTACGGDLDQTATPDTVGGEVVTPFGTTTGATTRTGGAAAPTTDAPMVAATLSEWRIQIPSDTLTAGRYTFRVQNSGQYAHALEIEGQGEERETDRLVPAASDELTVQLTPGTYELYCPIEDARGKHRELGMRRTLVVRAPSQ